MRRFITAVGIVALMVASIFGGAYSYVGIFAVITALCLYEFLLLTIDEPTTKRNRFRFLIGISLGLLPFLVTAVKQLELIESLENGYLVFAVAICFPLIFLAFIYELFSGSKTPFNNVAFIVLGMVYIGVPFALLNYVAFDDYGTYYASVTFGILLITWTNDTAAYVVGSQFGRTKLFPRISPGKTWEGSLGGAVFTFLMAYVLSQIFIENSFLSFNNWMVLAAISVIFGSLGDLVESMLKRSFSAKDSGNLLPGHGGILDRFDAFIFMLPFAAAYILLIR